MTYALGYSLSLGSSRTSLTLAAQLYDTTGTNSGSPITTGFAEIGNGCYYWYYASFANDFRGGVKFYESGGDGTILAHAAINPEEVEALTATLTEAYSADGSAGSAAELLYQINAFLQERVVSGTTVTVKKLDGSTTAMTFALDNTNAPTQITRTG